ncbi:translation initiation factor IF-2 [bacterium]|nr:MAG: translation initiation factor IF-2 [bacterium]
MAKVRVIEAAKQHDMDAGELLDALVKLGVKGVRSHLSPVEEEDVDKAIESLGKTKPRKKVEDAGQGAPVVMVRRRKRETAAEHGEEHPHEEGVEAKDAGRAPEPVREPETPEAHEPPAPAAEAAEHATPVEAPAEEVAPAAPVAGQARAAAEEKPHRKEAREAKKAPEKAAEVPAGKPEESEKEFGLKVVRFIRPEERVETPPAFVPPQGAYPMSKQERETRKAERKVGKKKRVRKDERVEQRRVSQKTQITVPKAIKRRIKISDVITVAELAKRMGLKATEAIKSLMKLGILATINQPLDVDTATLVADEFGYEIENIAMAEEQILQRSEDRPEDLRHRPPVITVMGHVDHGKTSLLDAIRKTRVAAGESGGITQHIGAYRVETSRGTLVFLDTPGHEAFTEMRARGAKVTDIVVLVVAANDGVMPQTAEAINHATAAKVPIIVAINKMDLPDANPDKVKRELADKGLVPEEWGGDVICVPVSAKKGDGIDTLLEMIAIQAEVMELTANPDKPASGVVVEARLDRGRGPVATVLVHEGSLNLGDIVLSGHSYGRVRTLTNDQGKREKKIPPGLPVEITGLSGVPEAGDAFIVVETERMAKEISSKRLEKSRELEMAQHRRVSLEDLHLKIAEGEIKTLNVIVKADVQGSVEAVAQSLEKLSNENVKVLVILKGVGGILESDVNLAIASEAIIVGFHVRAESKARTLAEQSGVDIRIYDVIYDATDDVKLAMTGLLAPRLQEKPLGKAEVREIFRVPKIGVVAGCIVKEGTVTRSSKLRLVRDNVVLYEGTLSSLKRFKDDVREVKEGLECGLSIQGFQDMKVGDVLEFYEIEEIAQTM